MSKSRTARRTELLRAPNPRCFYCGCGFDPEELNLPQKGQPGSVKASRNARPTLEHLVALARGGTDAEENTVLAHFWCNVLAGDLPMDAKLRLREQLHATGFPPIVPRVATAGGTPDPKPTRSAPPIDLLQQVALAIGLVVAGGRVEPRGNWLTAADAAINAIQQHQVIA
jgi:hypothetical protein